MRDDLFEQNLHRALDAYASEMPISEEALAAARGAAAVSVPTPRPWRWLAAPDVKVRISLVLVALALLAIVIAFVAGAMFRLLDRPTVPEIAVAWEGDVFAVDPLDGTRRVLVACPLGETACQNVDYGLAWSPDRRSLAYAMTRFISGDVDEPPDSELGLWILEFGGGGARRVRGCDEMDCTQPLAVAWSPDGSTIAAPNPDASAIDLIDPVDGSSRTVQFGLPIHAVAWSPDGTKLLFSATQGGRSHVFTASADGSNVAELVGEPGTDALQPAWSPDSARIAYLVYSPANEGPLGPGLLGHIRISNADGSAATTLFDGPVACCRGAATWGGPVWSPDGMKLAFIVANENRLYSIEVAGGVPVDLGAANGRTSPAWRAAR